MDIDEAKDGKLRKKNWCSNGGFDDERLATGKGSLLSREGN